MSTAVTSDAVADLATAEKELAEARELLAAAQRKVVNGEAELSDDHYRLVDAAELVAERARTRAERAARAERYERYAMAAAELADLHRGDEELRRALAEATRALRVLYELGYARYERYRDLSSRSWELKELAQRHGELEDLKAAGVTRPGDLYYRVYGPDGTAVSGRAREVRPGDLVALACRQAISEYARENRQLRYPDWPDRISSTSGQRSAEALGLAEAG